MAEFNGQAAHDEVMASAYAPPLPPTPGPPGVPPMSAPIPIPVNPEERLGGPESTPPRKVTPAYVDTNPVEASGFSDEFAPGYGYVGPSTSTDPSPNAPAGSDDWIRQIRDMAVNDPSRLQQYIALNPGLFPQVMLAIQTSPAPARPADPEQTDQLYLGLADGQGGPADEAREGVAQTGLRGWMARTFNWDLPKSGREQRQDLLAASEAVVHEILDRGEPVVIGVTSFKGGCGKTRIAVGLAKTLAHIISDVDGRRSGSVLGLDVDLHGMLQPVSIDTAEIRTDLEPLTTLCGRLAVGYSPDQIRLEHHVQEAEDGYGFIAGNHFGKAASISPEGYLAALEIARRHYPIVVVDMSQVQNTELHATVLKSLNALVMVTVPDEAEVNFLDGTRNLLSSHPGGVDAEHLIKHRVTVINHTKSRLMALLSGSSADTASVAARLKLHETGSDADNPRGADVSEVPFDWRIASRPLLKLDRLGKRTRIGLQLTAGALLDTLLSEESDTPQ